MVLIHPTKVSLLNIASKRVEYFSLLLAQSWITLSMVEVWGVPMSTMRCDADQQFAEYDGESRLLV